MTWTTGTTTREQHFVVVSGLVFSVSSYYY